MSCVFIPDPILKTVNTSWPSAYPLTVRNSRPSWNLMGTARPVAVGLHLGKTSDVDWFGTGTVHPAFAFTRNLLQ
jgi:hypothetical protein